MFVQTEETPNPNTLKFLPGKVVSEIGSFEFTDQDQTENKLIKDILSIEEIKMVFLGSGSMGSGSGSTFSGLGWFG